ncbi:zinc finger and BTB domain-containing protein 24-like [Topomyia yanbarensis]|uniref:zinc finger and BTB domain-containing protein 24-like n=1 Tax=Topomyia yanbarensis TaxID=2498891 RepID=UPI00273AD5D6|nr:zinc finger and BTB domain-containing protein 24-like [Topomyia yanbarensis]
MERRFHRKRGRQCRLCLREYNKSQLEDIFAKGSKFKSKIEAAVAVKPSQQDRTTRICTNCRNLVELIECFKEACQQSEILLTNEACVLQSDTWTCPDSGNIIRQAKDLVKAHQREIDAFISRHDSLGLIEQDHRAIELIPTVSERAIDEKSAELLVCVKEEEEEPDGDSISYLFQRDNQDQNTVLEDESDDTESDGGNDPSSNAKRTEQETSERAKERPEKVVCSTCGELVSQQVLEGHMNRHLGVQPFSCDFEGCDAKLHSKFALQQHRSRHKSANRYYDCEVCGKRIKGTAYWLIHRKIHTEDPRFSCEICGKKFRRKCKLKLHSTVHSGIAEFPCLFCGKYFTVKHNLTAHYKLHVKNGTHPPTGNN